MFKKTTYLLILIIGVSIFSCQEDDALETGDERDKIVNTWRCEEDSELYLEQFYDVKIKKDSIDENYILLYNFFDLKTDVKAKYVNKIITISNQTIDGFVIDGEGVVASNFASISWNYTVDDGSETAEITAFYTIKSPATKNAELVAEK